jgi:hypothetical protein
MPWMPWGPNFEPEPENGPIAQALRRAGFRCERCGQSHDPAAGPGLVPFALRGGDPAGCRPEDLVVLCPACLARVRAGYLPRAAAAAGDGRGMARTKAARSGKMNALKELGFTLWDALCCGDIPGHLRAWRRVVRGQVDLEARVVLTGAAVEEAGFQAAPACPVGTADRPGPAEARTA